MVAQDHDQVVALLNSYVVKPDDAILIPTINALMDYEAECALAIQRGSGNELDRLEEFLSLAIIKNLLSESEVVEYITMIEYAKKNAA